MTVPDWAAGLHSPLDDAMGFELLELSAERAVGRVPVEGNTQPFGLWHGGASCVLVESLASMAAAAYGMPDRVASGVDINVTHHKPVTQGWVTGVATALHLGRTTAHYEVVLSDAEGRRIGSGRVTCYLVPRPTTVNQKPAASAGPTS